MHLRVLKGISNSTGFQLQRGGSVGFGLVHAFQFLPVFLGDVPVAVSPQMRPVAGSLRPSLDHLRGHAFQVVRPTDAREEVDERGRRIEPVAQFSRFVIPGEHVVVIVPALAQGRHGHGQVLHGAYVPEMKTRVS